MPRASASAPTTFGNVQALEFRARHGQFKQAGARDERSSCPSGSKSLRRARNELEADPTRPSAHHVSRGARAERFGRELNLDIVSLRKSLIQHVQFIERCDPQRQVMQPNVAEAVKTDLSFGFLDRPQGHHDRAIGNEDRGVGRAAAQNLEAEGLLKESGRCVEVGDGQTEVVDSLGDCAHKSCSGGDDGEPQGYAEGSWLGLEFQFSPRPFILHHMVNQESLLPCVEIEPAQPALRSLIWLHGLGADGHDFESIVPELGLAPELRVRVILPHAPEIPVSINGGMRMPAWYDIRDANLANRHDEDGVRLSAAQLTQLIERENERGVASENIMLAGFSQGGAVALHVGLRHPEKLCGVIMLSTYAVLEQTIEAERSLANEAIPIFQAHGTLDPMVSPERGQAARELLEKLGHPVEWHDYPMQHQVCLEEIQDLSNWLTKRFEG